MSKKIIFIVVNCFLSIFFVSNYAFADNQFPLNVLSPKLSLEKISFEKIILENESKLLAELDLSSQEIENPYEVLGQISWRIRMNVESLIIREMVKEAGDIKKVHNSLLRIQSDGSEQFLGQCWYQINRNYAILAGDASNLQLPAFKIKEEGKNYGTVLFAAVLESARSHEVDYFSVYIAWTSIYELFGFKEVEYGILDELYKIITFEDSFLYAAINLSQERGIKVSFAPETMSLTDKLILAQTILSQSEIINQSI